MTYDIDWGDLERSQRLQDGDILAITVEEIDDPNSIEFTLKLGGGVNWWKGLEITNGKNRKGLIEASGSNGQAGPLRLSMDEITTGGKLILLKAKAFGVHTGMYELAYLEQKAGKRVNFLWVSDTA